MIDDEQLLLAAARRGLGPTPGDAARVKSGVVALLEGPAVSEVGEPFSSTPALPALARLLVVCTVAAASGTAGYYLGKRAGVAEVTASTPPRPSSLVVAEPSLPPARAVTAAAAPARSDPEPQAEPVVTAAPRRPATKVPLPPAEVVADPLEEELRTLRRVERSLRAGNPQLALALLRDLDSKVPAGKLIEERRAALAVATCTTNPGSRSAHLQGFADQFPGSVYAARVRASCADELPEDAIGPTDHHLSRDSAE